MSTGRDFLRKDSGRVVRRIFHGNRFYGMEEKLQISATVARKSHAVRCDTEKYSKLERIYSASGVENTLTSIIEVVLLSNMVTYIHRHDHNPFRGGKKRCFNYQL